MSTFNSGCILDNDYNSYNIKISSPECNNTVTQFNLSKLHRAVWLNQTVTVHPNVTSTQCWVILSHYKSFLKILLHVRALFNVITHILGHTWGVIIHTNGRHKWWLLKWSETSFWQISPSHEGCFDLLFVYKPPPLPTNAHTQCTLSYGALQALLCVDDILLYNTLLAINSLASTQ